MTYKLQITERAEELLDQILNYIFYNLKNEQAGKHLLDEMERIYDRLETEPMQFPICRDSYLANKGYREAIIHRMNYIVVFIVDSNIVHILGVFHSLEDYSRKIP